MPMDVSFAMWMGTISLLTLLLLIDLFVSGRKAHDVGFKEATAWSVFYIGVALGFGVWLTSMHGGANGQEFFAAYLVEMSLSVDNIFVFAIILTQFAVPSIYHQRVLFVGVILAWVLRGIFIAVGAAALAAWSWAFAVFGGLLIWTGIGLMRHWKDDPDPSDNIMVRLTKKFLPTTDEYHGTKVFIRQNGKRLATPLLLVMVAVAATDLLFALDSIPATFGVTSQPFLVFTANAFALLGLRALYFLLKGLLDRLVYLSLGLAAILIFIGFKLTFHYTHSEFHWGPKIETNASLIVIVVILVIAVVASLIKSSRDPDAKAHAGTITGH